MIPAPKPTAPAHGSGPLQGSEWIVEADASNFERGVLARSLTVPVLLDFWATWCGPCKTLGPELEKRAREGQGRFLLAKIDIDRNPELAQAFRVQAVPTVLAISEGRLVDGFQGALPASEIDAFLDRVAPSGALPSGTDAAVARARELAASGELEQAIGLLRELLRDAPAHNAARLVLAEILIDAKRPQDARLVLDKLEDDPASAEQVKSLRAKLDFAAAAGDRAELEATLRANPADLAARIQLAKALVAAKEYGPGLEHLLDVVRADAGAQRGEAKKTMLEVFAMLGLEDKLANEYRFKLSLELFS
ncbi:MAG: tetratricopeptide repeat protein [Planctomycetes bacterium]|nr:tetratricopeptide repeat protein [Planctomycetota bacterium]